MANPDIFKYCPRCSGRAELENSRKIACAGCGFGLYLNTAAAVGALIFDGEGRLLVIRRDREPRKGFLDLPGGFVDFGEEAEAALRREVLEELGVEVGDVGYLRSIPNKYHYGDVLYNTLDLFFTCRVDKSQPSMRINDEISEVQYRFPQDIGDDEIAFDSMKALIRQMRNVGADPRAARNAGVAVDVSGMIGTDPGEMRRNFT